MRAKRIVKATVFVVLALLVVSFASGAHAKKDKDLAKHIILIIGDGMNIEHEIATSRYLFGNDFDLSFHQLPYQANVATWDVSTYNRWATVLGAPSYDPLAIEPTTGYDPLKGGKVPYPLGPELPGAQDYHNRYDIEGTSLKVYATDSASAATAWATGYKTDDGNLAWLPGDPAGGARKTIAELLRERRGYSMGVVSTVPFTHATPAAHVSHNVSRNNYHAIGSEILTMVKPEVVIGGGYQAGSSCSTPIGSSYISSDSYAAVCVDTEYKVVTRQIGVDGGVALLEAAQEAARNGKKLFGLFGGAGGNFESLQPRDLPGTPVVKQATNENPTFTEATLAALKVLSQDPDGFFLMAEQGDIDWANHANDFQRMIGTTKDLHDGVKAAIDFVDQPDDDITWDNTLLIVTSDHSNSYMRNSKEKVLSAGDLPKQDSGGSCPPGYSGSCPSYQDGEVTYASTQHTNELVRLYAMGAGANKFHKYEGKWYRGTRILDNTQLFHMMMEAAGEPVDSPLNLVRSGRSDD